MKNKKIFLTFLVSIFVLMFTRSNMAPPAKESVASTITFEKNNEINVTEENLVIKFKEPFAYISVTYHMKNITDKDVKTPSMFLSPNIEECDKTTVKIDGTDVPFTTVSYEKYHHGDEVSKEGWKFVLKEANEASNQYDLIDTINFDLDFKPYQEYDVEVSYTYLLGGYSTKDNGYLYYYLTPASCWNGFKDLTIDLYLSENFPKMKSSLDFIKIDKLHYQYKSEVLPSEDLEISLKPTSMYYIKHNFINIIALTLTSIVAIIEYVVIPVFLIVFLIKYFKKRRKNNKKNKSDI